MGVKKFQLRKKKQSVIEEKKKEKYNHFLYIGKMFTKEPLTDLEEENFNKCYDTFMVNHTLGSNPDYFDVIIEASKFNENKKAHFLFLKSVFPKMRKAPFIKYMYKNKKTDIEIEALEWFFNETREDTVISLSEFYDKEEIKEITKEYKELNK